jgi:uncharacterized membrane protein (UPF0127 family)
MRFFAIVFTIWTAGALCVQASNETISYKEGALHMDGQTLHVQIADTPEAMERGLMYRSTMAPYDGMLFVLDTPQSVAFWMKDTHIPLDVGFFDSRQKLLEIHPLKPLDLTVVPSESSDVMYALELPAGNFAKKGLKVGDCMQYKVLDTSKKVLQ